MKNARLLLAILALSSCGSQGALSQAAIDQALAQGADPSLIYVVNLPGCELAEQSVGGVGHEGFGAQSWQASAPTWTVTRSGPR